MSSRSWRAAFVSTALLSAVFFAQGAAVAQPARGREACVSAGCHDAYQKMSHVHAPIALGVCRFCHRPVGGAGHAFKLLREGGRLCGYCHWDRDIAANPHRSLGSRECIGCHSPHASENKFLLYAANLVELCRGCHGDVLEGKRSLHTPVATGKCATCHDLHGSPTGGPPKTKAEQLCYTCHEATRDELDRLAHVHEPVCEARCQACHDPHGGANAMNLREDVPALCYSCHPEISDVVQHATHKHGVAGQKDGCLKCHTAHASTAASLLKRDPMSLCLSCHDRVITTDDGRTLANVKSEVEHRRFLHGPVAQKNCNACHLSHGSEHSRLLTQEYTAEFYAAFDRRMYALCFGCHPEESVLARETASLTDFRNGRMNLHYVHVNKSDRGRTCRACHTTHGSDQPKQIRDSVPFGTWEMPLRFEKTPTGGGCWTGCHEPRTYDRKVPVDYGAAALPGGRRPTSDSSASSRPAPNAPRGEKERDRNRNEQK